MNKYWRHNLEALKRFKPDVYEQVKDQGYNPVGDFVETPSGFFTMRFANLDESQPVIMAYNNQDPRQDVVGHLQTVPTGSRGLVVFIGMGLGYGPLLIQEERPEVSQVVILEPSLEFFCTALMAINLESLIASKKVTFMVGDIDLGQLEAVISRIAALEDTHILRHGPSFRWDHDKYSSIDNQAFMLINQLNVQGGTTSSIGPQFFRNRYSNLTLLRHCYGLDSITDLFKGKPAVVVAAGPSLSESLPQLKELVGRCVMIAADSAMAPLQKAGIMPDFVTSIDFQEINFEKLGPFVGKQWPFSLVSMLKSGPLVPKRFQPRHLILAVPEDRPHDWIVDTLGIKTLAPACFSVAHLALGLALIMGADPIIFVGQDLAFTSDASDHAKGTILAGNGLPTDEEIFYVEGIGGGKLQTDRAFLGFKKNFEDIIVENPRNYINASAAGAHIEGTRVADLASVREAFMKESLGVIQIIDDALREVGPYPVEAFIGTSQKILSLIKKVKRQLTESLDLSGAAKRQLVKLQKKRFIARSLEDLPDGLKRQLLKFDKLNNSTDAHDPLWQHVLELTFNVLSDNDRLREQNDQVRDKEGYLSWVLAEIERIDRVNKNRTDALNTYQKLLGGLVKHLQQEEKLLVRIVKNDAGKDLFALMQLYTESSDLYLAKEMGERLLAKNCDDMTTHLLMGEIYAGLIDIEAARKHWGKVLEIEPGLKQQVDQARKRAIIPWVINAENCDDRYPRLLAGLLERIETIIEDEEAALPEPLQKLWGEHCEKINESLKDNDTHKAATILRPWEVVKSKLTSFSYWQARCLAAGGDNVAALEEIGKVLGENQDAPEVMAFMAKLLIECGKFDEGIKLLQQAVEIDPQTAVIWEELGDALMSSGDFISAATAYERCFVALPDRIDVLSKMGDCYLNNQQPQAAIATYQEVLGKAPDHQQARLHLAKAKEMESILHMNKTQ